jgi:hypothetical protein
VPTGPDTNCNGIDEDCSGTADDGYVPDATCGLGVCGAPNNTPSSCVAGVETACTPGPQDEPTDVTCDGLDGDCDGSVDEDYVSVGTNCGQGVCAATGATSCVGGVVQDSCTPGPQDETTDVTCDGLDGDCDGAVDEDYVTSPTACGTGVCAATGQMECQGGSEVDTCTPGPQDEATDVTCDGLDGDCDGTCEATEVCNGVGGVSCTPGAPGTEGPFGDPTCGDTVDNDCDGDTDGADVDCIGTVDYATEIQPIWDASRSGTPTVSRANAMTTTNRRGVST